MKIISQKIRIGQEEILMRVPDPEYVKQKYSETKNIHPDEPFPYWTRLWPAAIAMSEFILGNREIVKNKTVLEIGAGLGLPSIVSSLFATKVIWSDYLPSALEWMKDTIHLLEIKNLQCRLLDLFCLPGNLDADVLLLSDINYDPSLFEHVDALMNTFFKNNRTILLATPQRLTAASFIQKQHEHIVHQEDRLIESDDQQTLISIFVLR